MPIPDKMFLKQKPMLVVCYGLSPLLVAAIYLFGWRSLAVAAVVTCAGLITEACFTFPKGKPVTSAVLVTSLIFSLSLPPTIPFWIAIIGIIVGVALGKMAFGGFGTFSLGVFGARGERSMYRSRAGWRRNSCLSARSSVSSSSIRRSRTVRSERDCLVTRRSDPLRLVVRCSRWRTRLSARSRLRSAIWTAMFA